MSVELNQNANAEQNPCTESNRTYWTGKSNKSHFFRCPASAHLRVSASFSIRLLLSRQLFFSLNNRSVDCVNQNVSDGPARFVTTDDGHVVNHLVFTFS